MNPHKPHVLKLLQGTDRPSRTNANEPKPEVAAPPMPQALTRAAKAYWRLIMPHLLTMGVVTVADGAAMVALCECYAELVTARETLRTSGDVELGFKLARQIDATDRRLKNWLNEFGLTPASRHRVSGSPVKDANPFDAF
jgi:P27 family predicted phage terminase small subunit